jgi:nucleoid-associated protein YgaU
MFAKFLALLVAGLVLWTIAARPSGAHGDKTVYRVQPYDTLWSIASSHYGGDVRDAVWRIQRANHLPDATIQPGERLVLP